MYPPQYPQYPPYPGYPQYPYMQQPMRPQRSGLPRVLGVLAIVFCCVGMLGSAIWWFGPLDDIQSRRYGDLHADLDPVTTWLHVWLALSGVVFVLHLIAGILTVQYKRSGLKLMTVYGIAAIALAILDIVLVNVLMPGRYHHEGGDLWFSVVTMHIVFSVMAVPWPIVALALGNSAKAKEACGTPTANAADVF